MPALRTNLLRLLALSVVPALITGSLVVASPAPALAASAADVVVIPCPGWVPDRPGIFALPEAVIDAQPSFLISESRIVVNDLDTPATGTFTSQTSRTFGISATASVSFSGLFGFLSANVSSSVTSSTTTSIGVSAQAQVPPHSRLIGDYGVDAYQVSFVAYTVYRGHPDRRCKIRESVGGHETHHATTPTNIQGWRVRLG